MSDQGWEYRGRWALITGASAGIGEVFARSLAARGMNLVLAARREDRLRALARELTEAHRVHTHVVQADLTKPGAAGVLWMDATSGRRISLLVNNAGFGLKGDFRELPAVRQVEMVKVNCIAPMELAHLAVREMWSAGEPGGVINVASVAGYLPIPTLATYAATKAFLISFSEALAEECRDSGIRVVTLNPGPVQTEFQSVAGTNVNQKTLGVRTPEQVVGAGLARLEAGGGTVTPGLSNQLSSAMARMAPRGLVVRAAKAVYQRLR
jgi:short-subunit dehydrogenase